MKYSNLRNKINNAADIIRNPEFASGSAMIIGPQLLNRPHTGNYVIDVAAYLLVYGIGLGLMFDAGFRWMEKKDQIYVEKNFPLDKRCSY